MVEESFRGVSGPRVSVGTATTMCDTKFKKGKRYLVYASLDDKTNLTVGAALRRRPCVEIKVVKDIE